MAVIDDGVAAPSAQPPHRKRRPNKPRLRSSLSRLLPPASRLMLVPAAPATRRLAREMGIDICEIAPTGAGGRVTPEDVEAFAEKKKAPVKGKKLRSKAPEAIEPVLAEAKYAAHAALAIISLRHRAVPRFTQWGPREKGIHSSVVKSRIKW